MSPRSYRQAREKDSRQASDGCRISPSLTSQTYIVPAKEGGYHLKGSASQAFRALLSLTLLCTGGLTYAGGKIQVPHLRGMLQLERRPERIAVLDYQYADQLLALGVAPVGSVACSVETGGLPVDLAEPLNCMARLGTKEQPNLRVLAAMQPELIVCTSFHEGCYADLAAIAPTIMLDRNEDWRQSLFRLGELVGRQWRALEAIDAYNAKLDRLRRKLKDGGGSPIVALIRPRGSSIRLHTVRHRTARLLYEDLELAAPPLAGQQTGTSSLIPLNTLPELRADRLFVLTDDTNREQTRLYQQSPVWQSMNAVRCGQVSQVHTALWIGYYGPIAMNRVVDEIAEALL
ncbi:ABC transporter substrate-binding protein [Paenibacillus sp. XY044]|uniref:ABC transporter substrate-binding protein n=1 Tax=Paenibacillus sp. XY044 TaxID=2026089 RepID=UPI00359C341F